MIACEPVDNASTFTLACSVSPRFPLCCRGLCESSLAMPVAKHVAMTDMGLKDLET
jgi:hypothetical protein